MSFGPLPYWGGDGSSATTGSSLYERKMKWWTGFDSVGLTAYMAARAASMARGTNHGRLLRNRFHPDRRVLLRARPDEDFSRSVASGVDGGGEKASGFGEGVSLATMVPRLGPVSPIGKSKSRCHDDLVRRRGLSLGDNVEVSAMVSRSYNTENVSRHRELFRKPLRRQASWSYVHPLTRFESQSLPIAYIGRSYSKLRLFHFRDQAP